jgi:hypothetical protein
MHASASLAPLDCELTEPDKFYIQYYNEIEIHIIITEIYQLNFQTGCTGCLWQAASIYNTPPLSNADGWGCDFPDWILLQRSK